MLPLFVLGVAAAVLGPGPALPSPDARPPTKVTVTMGDYTFALSRKSVRRGVVVFTVVNRGAVVHDFKIAGRKTPVYGAGERGVLRVTLRRAGRYPYVCTVPGHALAGMKGVLRVTV